MAHDSPRIFTIPAGTPFLDALAASLVADPTLGARFGASLDLSDITILLPTRRAVRALGDAFLRMGEGRALLLPSIRPLGDVDEDELVLAPALGQAEALSLPPAMPALARQFRLARLIIEHWTREGAGAHDTVRAVALGADLGRFLDMAITERVELAGLQGLVPDEFAAHWQITIDLLKVLTESWPAELARLGFMDEASRRNALLEAQTAAWAAVPPARPIIAAGSTGSIPATGDLLSLVARLPLGAVVLPGLDTDLDAEGWEAIDPSHPQYGIKQLLTRMGAARDDVAAWPGPGADRRGHARARLLSEALRPAETTERWRARLDDLARDAEAATLGLSLVEAPTPRDEAGAIAMMMRETLETPARTAALITPDRALARRVAMELRRWNIEVDDSGGVPLAQTAPLAFLRLIVEMVAQDFAPVALLACLKHPLAALGGDALGLRTDIRHMERALLRGPRPAPGIAGLRAALAEARDGRDGAERDRRDGAERDRLARLDDLVDRLEAACAPLAALFAAADDVPLADLVTAHVTCAEHLAATGEAKGGLRLWAREEGEASADFITELIEAAPALGPVEPPAYPGLFADLAGARVLRPRFGRHPRLFIWGPLEARLQHADRIVLGGLNEGKWPAEANIDPWLNRPMRAALGLEPPERRIGQAAHDFVGGASAHEAVLTRALKVDGAPTVASRWLLRLEGLLKGIGRDKAIAAPDWTRWARELDEPASVAAVAKPMPRPPLAARPVRFRVTEIETLIRDPYAIYARRILNLHVLDPIDADFAAAERGTIIHKALEKFSTLYPKALPENALPEFYRIGEEVFREAMERPGVAAFWWPRFQRIAHWIVDFERDWRADLACAHAEVSGEIVLDGLARPTVLAARADRIDDLADGTLAIIDYKTGQVPSLGQVAAGLAPQLPLEAAIAARGGFENIPAARASRLLYLRLTGGNTAGEPRLVAPDGLVDETFAHLIELLAQYENEATPYLSRPRPMFEGRFGDYDHLARVKEWSASGGEGE